jgi:hypothetical protein
MGKVIGKCGIIGGIVVFIWMLISWMLIPWHSATINKFENEEKVATVLKENAPVSGVYMLPNMCHFKSPVTKEEMQKYRMAEKEMMRNGPIVFAGIRKDGVDPSSAAPFIRALIIQIVAGFFVTWLLLMTKGLKYMQQVGFITLLGFLAGIMTLLPAWNWCGFSTGYVVVGMLDLIIGWFLAGLAIAKLARK